MKCCDIHRFAIIALVLLTAASCEPPGSSREPAATTPRAAAPTAAFTEDNIGDAEQAVDILVDVAPESAAPNIESTPLVNMTGRMDLLTLDVAPPYPTELWLKYELRSRRAFSGNPVVLRITTTHDGSGEVIDRFTSMIGNAVQPTVSERRVNALQGLDGIPETMLLRIQVEALLMPRGTDPETVDPETAETTPDRRSTAVATPPIRINFKGGPQPPAAAPVTPDELTDDAPAPSEEPPADAAQS